MKRKVKVYVAGKLNDDAVGYNKNRSRMLHCALDLHDAGFSVFVPCLIEQVGLIDGYWEYEDYFNNSQPWLEVSDAVFLVPGWETSTGTKEEVKLAKKLGIPVFSDMIKIYKQFRSWI